jgi:quinohemoprotein ethanol dehydrogenase
VPVNWAEKIDLKTGRPVEAAFARYLDKPSMQMSGPLGGHNWQPMAFDPKEGLVFIPAIVLPGAYSQPKDFTFIPGAWNTGQGGMAGAAGEAASMPAIDLRQLGGRLIAWDPVKQEQRWNVRFSGPWNSGLLATAGGLVFGGDGPSFNAYAANDGKKLWSYAAGAGIIAPPSTYELGGVQYVALMVGPGGAGNVAMGGQRRYGRLLVFKLGGGAVVPPHEPPPPPRPALDLSLAENSAGNATAGQAAFVQYCTACHGGGSFLPDVRTSPILLQKEAWKAVVHDGVMKDRGMASFAKFLNEAETENMRAYLLTTLREANARRQRR